MSVKKIILVVILGGVVVGGWIIGKPRLQQWQTDREKAKLPAATTLADSIAGTLTAPVVNAVANRAAEVANLNSPPPETPAHIPVETPVGLAEIPTEKNLAVPFTSQAPHANWDLDHNEFCEEAAVLMAGRFYQRRDIASKDDAEAGLQEIKKWQVENLGFYYDTTAVETKKIIEGIYNLKVELKTDPSIEDIKRAIANNKLVIVPAAGRELGNPNYTPPGPIYHMLLIRGYTDDGRFITNDAGTRKGEQFTYKQEVVMDAIHDWVPKEPRTEARNGTPTGGKVALFVGE